MTPEQWQEFEEKHRPRRRSQSTNRKYFYFYILLPIILMTLIIIIFLHRLASKMPPQDIPITFRNGNWPPPVKKAAPAKSVAPDNTIP